MHPAGSDNLPVTDAVADASVVGAVLEPPLARCGSAHMKRMDTMYACCCRTSLPLCKLAAIVQNLGLCLARRKCVGVLLLLGTELKLWGVGIVLQAHCWALLVLGCATRKGAVCPGDL